VVWNRLYEPWANARDSRLKTALREAGLAVESFNARLLREPWEPRTGGGEPYKVFTPYWRALARTTEPGTPLPAPNAVPVPADPPASEALDAWGLTPTAPDWAGGLRATWTPGERGAHARLRQFAYAHPPARPRRKRPDAHGRWLPPPGTALACRPRPVLGCVSRFAEGEGR